MRKLIGHADILFITLDTLRYDAAMQAWRDGALSTLGPYLGSKGWEKRHSPGNFTYAAHHAFFAGFLPTPLGQGPHPRLYAAEFSGSLSVVDTTFTFKQATLPEALADHGYHTVCIGGTGFFHGQNALASVFPKLFIESHWSPELGVACRTSSENQVAQAIRSLEKAGDKRVFLFINISAIHEPNWFYGAEHGPDTFQTHTAALIAADAALSPLFQKLKQKGPAFVIICSDHGTAYGEEGYHGHRLGHEVVWTVPYAEFML
ncbi:MAG: STM4013/SEN3800 family hydrolase [Verrucomicrobiales bacterium]